MRRGRGQPHKTTNSHGYIYFRESSTIGQRQASSSDSYLITSAQTAAGLLAMMTHGRLEDRLGPSRTCGYPVRPYDFGHECVHVASLVCAWWQVTGRWSRVMATPHLSEGRLIMSTCDICHADDVVAQRSSRGTDAQQRVVVHQQCPRGHRWHLAFEIADNPLGDRDTLICDCPVEGVSI